MATILIADDSHFHQALFTRALEEKGFQLIVAEDGVHATMIAQRVQPDAIVLDLSMPGGSGVEVLKRLKRSAKTKSIPVFIVTASEDPATRDMVTSLGASEFLQKPINLEQLAGKISALLNLPDSAKQKTESRTHPLPIPAKKEPLSQNLPKQSRSWRKILRDVAEQDRKQI